MAEGQMRLRLEVGHGLESTVIDRLGHRIWWQPSAGVANVNELVLQLREYLGLGSTYSLLLFVDGYALPPAGPATLVRDGDSIVVERLDMTSPIARPGKVAKRSAGSKLALVAAEPAAAWARPAQGKRRRRAATAEACVGSEGGSSGRLERKKRRVSGAAAPAPALALGADNPMHPDPVRTEMKRRADKAAVRRAAPPPEEADPGSPAKRTLGSAGGAGNANGAMAQVIAEHVAAPAKAGEPLGVAEEGDLATSSSSDNESSDGEAGPGAGQDSACKGAPALAPACVGGAAPAAKRTPSRSARRKKLKRQLRKQGLLAPRPAASTRPAALRTAATAPALNPHANGGPTSYQPPSLALPRRGEARAMSPREAEFVASGHIHFADSDRDDMDEGGVVADAAEAAGGRPAAAASRPSPSPNPLPSLAFAATCASGPAPGPPARAYPPPPLHKPWAADREPNPGTNKARRALPAEWTPGSAPECEGLPPVVGAPLPGDLVAYRLLHVGADWAPAVSPWRLGRVRSLQESAEAPSGSTGQVVVEPWPAAYFPQCALLCGGGWQHRVERGTPWRPEAASDERGTGGGGEAEEEEEEEGPPTDYDAAGVLSTQLASFSELRLLRAGNLPPGEDGGALQAPTRALHTYTLAGGARGGDLSHAHAGSPRGRAHAGAAGPDAARRLHAESAPAAAEPGASELAQPPHGGAVVTAHEPPGAGGTLQNLSIGVTAGGATMRGGSLRVPQPPARHTMAAQQYAGVSQPDASPDLNPDPRKGAAGAARRALASGLAPLAVARRMRGTAGGDAEGGAGGSVAAGPAGTPAPRPAPGRPPARPAVVPGVPAVGTPPGLGSWAVLAEQLARRRAELAAGGTPAATGPPTIAGPPAPPTARGPPAGTAPPTLHTGGPPAASSPLANGHARRSAARADAGDGAEGTSAGLEGANGRQGAAGGTAGAAAQESSARGRAGGDPLEGVNAKDDGCGGGGCTSNGARTCGGANVSLHRTQGTEKMDNQDGNPVSVEGSESGVEQMSTPAGPSSQGNARGVDGGVTGPGKGLGTRGPAPVATPGATKPRPGVHQASLGAFLLRLRSGGT